MFNKPPGGKWRGTSDSAVRPLMGSLEERDAVISQLHFKSAVSSTSSSRWCRGGSGEDHKLDEDAGEGGQKFDNAMTKTCQYSSDSVSSESDFATFRRYSKTIR